MGISREIMLDHLEMICCNGDLITPAQVFNTRLLRKLQCFLCYLSLEPFLQHQHGRVANKATILTQVWEERRFFCSSAITSEWRRAANKRKALFSSEGGEGGGGDCRAPVRKSTTLERCKSSAY